MTRILINAITWIFILSQQKRRKKIPSTYRKNSFKQIDPHKPYNTLDFIKGRLRKNIRISFIINIFNRFKKTWGKYLNSFFFQKPQGKFSSIKNRKMNKLIIFVSYLMFAKGITKNALCQALMGIMSDIFNINGLW